MLMCKREDGHRGVLCVLLVLWEVPLPFRVWGWGRGCLGVGGSLGTPGGGLRPQCEGGQWGSPHLLHSLCQQPALGSK